MALHTRRLGPDDPEGVHVASRRLGTEAFGTWPSDRTPPPLPVGDAWPAGVAVWATVDDTLPDPDAAGEPLMVARVRTHDYTSWFGGAAVPTTGYAGVAVTAEHRGTGLLTELFATSLVESAAAGSALSTLYPTAPGIYRRFGYEVVAAYDTVEVPTAALAGVRPAPSVRTRRATAADVPAVIATYDAWASAQNGPLTRRGPLFGDAEKLLDDVFAVTLAEEVAPDGSPRVVGFASWDRGSGYDASTAIDVHDLVALTGDAARALWRVLGSFSSVAGRIRLRTSDPDVTRFVLPSLAWERVESRPYMLRLLDLPAALAPRTLPVDGTVDLTVHDDPAGLLDGTWRITARDGVATAERHDAPDASAPRSTVAGLSLLYAGAQGTANLRMAGHLGGPTSYDALLDAWFGGRQVHVRDYF